MKRRRLWLVPLLLAIAVLGGWYFGYRAKGEDRELPVYVTGGERMAAGEEIYRRGADAKPFTYPPFAAVPFVPFALLPKSWQPPAWFCVNFVILLLIGRWLQTHGRREDPATGPPRMVWFWVITLVVGARHVTSVLTNQSHDLLIAAAVALAAASWCRGRSVAGVWAGAGAAMKATPLLFLGLFALRLRVWALVCMLLAAAALTLLPDWWFPRADGQSWVRAWYDVNLRGLEVGGTADARGAWNPHSYLNQSMSGTLTRLLTPVRIPGPFVEEHTNVLSLSESGFSLVSRTAQLLILAVIAAGILGARRVVRAAADPAAAQRTVGLGEVAAIACGMVLLSPQSSKSHFCVWLFPAAFLADRLLRGRRDVVAWVLLAFAFAFGSLTGKGLVGTEFGAKLNACGNVTWCTVLLLAATVRALWTVGRRTNGAVRGDQAAPGSALSSTNTSPP